MRDILYRLGQHPRQSLKRFLQGFALFMAGVALVAAGYYTWFMLQLPGLLLIAFGTLIAGWGYIGMLANRLLRFIDS